MIKKLEPSTINNINGVASVVSSSSCANQCDYFGGLGGLKG